MFDPDQAGFRAAIRAVHALHTQTDDDEETDAEVTESAPEEPSGQAASAATSSEPARNETEVKEQVEEVYQLTTSTPDAPRTANRGAVYTLEFPISCPQCFKEISTIRVSRLIRTHVSFTSTLPRKGYIIVCPECDGLLSAELSGLI